MVIFVGIVGFLSGLGALISSIFSFIDHIVWAGVAYLFIMFYIVSVTVLLIRSDAGNTRHENDLKKLKEEVRVLKERLGIKEEKPKDEESEDEVWDENDGEWKQAEDGTWSFSPNNKKDEEE